MKIAVHESLRGVFLVLLVAIGAAGVLPAVAEGRSLRLDDVLDLEGYDSAVISPDGRWLVFEKVRPYSQNTDFSFRTYAWGRSGHQLYRYDLDAQGEPSQLKDLDSDAHSYQVGFSPEGIRLAVMQYQMGRLTLGAYDMDADRHTVFGPTPAFSRDGEHNPVWLSDTELVYAALPDGAEPALTSVRAHTARLLQDYWQAAWAGAEPTAREVRTGLAASYRDPNEDGDLVRVDAATGETRVLARGLYADLRVSPDGTQLAALSVMDSAPLDAGDLALEFRRTYRLSVFDLNTDLQTALAPDLEFSPYTITWAPDGRRLAAFGWPVGGDARQGRFYIVDIETVEVTGVPHDGLELASERERGWLQRPERAVFFNGGLAVFARPLPPGQDRAGRFTYQDIRPQNLVPAHWYRIGAGSGPKNLTEGLTEVSAIPLHGDKIALTVLSREGIFQLAPDGSRRLLGPSATEKYNHRSEGNFATRAGQMRPEFSGHALFRAEQDGRPVIVMLEMGSSTDAIPVVLSPEGERFEPLAGSIEAGAILYRSETGEGSELRLYRVGSRGPDKVLTQINHHLFDVNFGEWRSVKYASPQNGGTTTVQLEACVLLPPNYDPDTPPPLIIDLYPDVPSGCRSRTTRMSHPDPNSPYIWAAQGFAYVRLPMPRALIWRPDAPIGGMPVLAEAGADAIVQAGLVNPDRIVLHGFSQGGVSALYVAAHSDRFAAVIAKNSWADYFSHYFGTVGINSVAYDRFGSFQRYDTIAGSDFGIGKTPFEAPEVYYRNSPVFLAPNITSAVLLIHSDLDSFALSQFDEMFGALDRAGKDARYVRYFGEGHGPSSPANIRDMWARQVDFLASVGITP